MGLSMYLTAERFFTYDKPRETRDGMEIESEKLRAAYWRKFADLHGYFVQTFLDGVDECQELELTADQLQQVIDAVEADELPHTTGFFFRYERDEAEAAELKAYTLESLKNAKTWLETKEPGCWRSITYRASW